MPEECFGRITGLKKLRGVSLRWHQTPARLCCRGCLVCLPEGDNSFIPNMSCTPDLDVDESGCPRNEIPKESSYILPPHSCDLCHTLLIYLPNGLFHQLIRQLLFGSIASARRSRIPRPEIGAFCIRLIHDRTRRTNLAKARRPTSLLSSARRRTW